MSSQGTTAMFCPSMTMEPDDISTRRSRASIKELLPLSRGYKMLVRAPRIVSFIQGLFFQSNLPSSPSTNAKLLTRRYRQTDTVQTLGSVVVHDEYAAELNLPGFRPGL